MSARISQLVIYPIKSCGGCFVEERELAPGGLLGDRRYMLIDEQGEFVTRRTVPRLCLAQVTLRGDEFSVFVPDQSPLDLGFRPGSDAPEWGDMVRSRVWRDEVMAREHREGSAWFTAFLGRAVRLVHMPDDALRQVNPARARLGDVVSFADGYPLLLCTEASLDDLNRRLDAPLPMNRFRPNVVVKGTRAFEEDSWTSVDLGGIAFDVPKGCDRCAVTTFEEGTGRSGKEPLKTLATFRKREGAVWFGVNLIGRSRGTLRVGDEVRT